MQKYTSHLSQLANRESQLANRDDVSMNATLLKIANWNRERVREILR
jgi:hypothetical protein